MKLVVSLVFVALALGALVFVIWGESLIGQVPSVKRFREAHKRWSVLPLKSSFSPPRDLMHVVQRRFEEVGAPDKEVDWGPVRHKRLGDVVTLVAFKERDLKDLAKEMRHYCALFLVLLVVGVTSNLKEIAGKNWQEVSEALLSYHTIPMLEVTMIGYLAIRLMGEAQSIDALLENSER